MITVKNLSKRFGETVAVNNVSFEVSKGEILGFLGPNGAGKTTTMKIITCYLPPDKGSVQIGDLNIQDHSLEIRKKIGYLPENTPLYMDMGVVDYILFIAELRQIPKSKRIQKMREMVEICSLEREIKKNIGELSKGYRQRVGLAQTLIHDPEILILDEPTSGLDPNQIIEIRELIKKISREKTIIISTHILPEVTATCNRAIIIHNGKLVADGTTEELADKSRGRTVYYVKLKGPRDQVQSRLQELISVESARLVSGANGDVSRFEIIAQKGKDPCEDIYNLSVKNGWIMTELSQERASLENVFRELTSG
ncbi:ATP-binding cassette domain-containing protein [Candidatus Sumerlaeota bacterium]|nr:ATP-binding cassette domain-containing protein [Candidatus Sumerlaeota bacterium]